MTSFDLLILVAILSIVGFFSFTVKVQYLNRASTRQRFWLVFWGGPIVWLVALWFWFISKFE